MLQPAEAMETRHPRHNMPSAAANGSGATAVAPGAELLPFAESLEFQLGLLRQLDAVGQRAMLAYIRRAQGDRHADQLLAELRGAAPSPSRTPAPEPDDLTSADWTQPECDRLAERWGEANLRNLLAGDVSQYRRVIERRDFYRWFYEYTASRGWETRWALAAWIVANGAYELSCMPAIEGFAAAAGAVNNELQGIMRQGNQVIFEDVFPKLRALLERGPVTGKAALEWDVTVLSEEQELVQPLYDGMGADTFRMLDAAARMGRLASLGAWRPFRPDANEILPGRYHRGGVVPGFCGADLRSSDDRWHYGLSLADRFSPGGIGYGPHFTRPRPSDPYRSGDMLARLWTRPHLHILDAELDHLLLADIDAGRVRSLLGRLTPAEQAEVLRDQSPDGWAYSDRLRRVLTPREIAYALTGFRVDLVEQMHFLGACLAGGWGWRKLTYGDVRPLILVFPAAERARLGTDEWLPVFLQLCDDVTIVDAVHDLDLPFAAQRAWVEAERNWF